MYAIGELQTLCELACPQVGIVTNVGISHLSRLGTVENIARAKAELVQSLPTAQDGGIAILNWDDPRVRAMAHETSARIFSYGLTPEAELWADDIESVGYDGIRFNLHHHPPATNNQRPVTNDQKTTTNSVTLPLLGRHHVYTALAATAAGLSQGLSWETILKGLQSLPNQLRLVLIPAIHQATIIDDTYNASPASGRAALDLLADLEPKKSGRRIAVLGDMLELGHQTETGHHAVGEYTAHITDLLITVGKLGEQMAHAAHQAGLATQQIHRMPDDRSAITLLNRLLQPDDLVLVKGSRAVGMDKIVKAISDQQEPVKS